MTDHCQIPRCREEADVAYLGHGICSPHWDRLTNERAPADGLRMGLGLPAAHEPEVEDTMSSKKKTPPTEQPATETPQADVAAAPAPEKKAKSPKAAKAEKAVKSEKPKAEPRPKEEDLVVFAFRLTQAERNLIHAAAGPARASRFVRTIAVAAANEDEAAIRETIKEAREAR